MTQHDRALTDQQMHRLACIRAMEAAIDACEHLPDGQAWLGQVLCAALETVGGGAPDYDLYSDLRKEAAFWADISNPLEIEAYTAAALRKIERTEFARGARKRIFWALWETFGDDDRRSFLDRAKKGRPP